MKKLVVLVLTLVFMLTCFVACASPAEESASAADKPAKEEAAPAQEAKEIKEVAIMVPSADHGWTGAVLTYAQAKADELNADADFSASFSAKVYAATDVENQIQQVDDLLSNVAKLAGVVILPYDNGLQSTLEKIAAEDVPFVQFDRVIQSEAIDATVVANVKGDNVGIGYETAKRFIANGLTKDDYVYELIGDNSSVPEMRSQGFRKYLGEQGWTEAEIEAVVVKSAATGWSRDNGKDLFESWFGSAQCDPAKNNWIYTHDDEIGVGVMESLNGSALDESKKAEFMGNFQALAASSGLAEMYAILKDEHKVLSHPTDYDLFSVTYDPGMIMESVQVMVDSLNGANIDQDYVIPVSVVDKENVSQFQAFGSY